MAVSCGNSTKHVAKTQFALALEWSTYVEVIINLPHCRDNYFCIPIGLREFIFFFCVFRSCFLLCVHSLCLYFPVFHFNFLPFLFNIFIMVFHFFGSSCPRAEKEYYLPGRISCLILRFWCFFKHATVLLLLPLSLYCRRADAPYLGVCKENCLLNKFNCFANLSSRRPPVDLSRTFILLPLPLLISLPPPPASPKPDCFWHALFQSAVKRTCAGSENQFRLELRVLYKVVLQLTVFCFLFFKKC